MEGRSRCLPLEVQPQPGVSAWAEDYFYCIAYEGARGSAGVAAQPTTPEDQCV